MRNQDSDREKSKIERSDRWGRTYFGSPSLGGLIIVIIVILYLIFK